MQLIGLILLFVVIGIGFIERSVTTVTSFDWHALLIILLGCTSAVLLGSSKEAALKTVTYLREILPGFKRVSRESKNMDKERSEIYSHWKSGKRGLAIEVSEKSKFKSSKEMVQLLLTRGQSSAVEKVFTELKHSEMEHLQPAMNNWELLSKLGPSFGMVGTITGMIQLFKNMGSENANIGAAMSLALLATLYGVAFGAGIAGPIGHFLSHLLDERLGVLDRCEDSTNDLVANGDQA